MTILPDVFLTQALHLFEDILVDFLTLLYLISLLILIRIKISKKYEKQYLSHGFLILIAKIRRERGLIYDA